MEKCIICNKTTQEKNASGQTVHIACMKSYREADQRLVKESLQKYGRVL